MLEKPIHPYEYARQYREWELDLSIVEQMLTCVCQNCAVCCIVRPFALQANYPNEVSKNLDIEEYPEDEYYGEEE